MEDESRHLGGETTYLDENGWEYSVKPNGDVSFGDVSRNLLGKQNQYGSRFIDGSVPGYPKLGVGLRFSDLEGPSYHDIGIHPDDIEEFVHRFYAWNAYKKGWVTDDHGRVEELDFVTLDLLEEYLIRAGVEVS